jgi:transposase
MGEERISLSVRERDRLKVLYLVEQGKLQQAEAAGRLQLSERQLRRLLARVRQQGDAGLVHRLRGRASNRKLAAEIEQRAVAQLHDDGYAGFGPTLGAEHLARLGIQVSRETLRKWMMRAGLWRARRQKIQAVHVWRERRAAFGELVMWDSSAHRWLEDRGPLLQLILMIDDATSRIWGHFAEHDTTEENFRALQAWLLRWSRPVAYYTDKATIFRATGQPRIEEQLAGENRPRTQIARALAELGIGWIATHSPQAKGRIENAFGTLQDRLIKEMRLAGIGNRAAANEYFQQVFVPFWEQRFARAARRAEDAHRPLSREMVLASILSVQTTRRVARDYTVSWEGERWGVPRQQVRAGLRNASVQIERRLDGSRWLRFRGQFLPLVACPEPQRAASPSGLRPPGPAVQQSIAAELAAHPKPTTGHF